MSAQSLTFPSSSALHYQQQQPMYVPFPIYVPIYPGHSAGHGREQIQMHMNRQIASLSPFSGNGTPMMLNPQFGNQVPMAFQSQHSSVKIMNSPGQTHAQKHLQLIPNAAERSHKRLMFASKREALQYLVMQKHRQRRLKHAKLAETSVDKASGDNACESPQPKQATNTDSLPHQGKKKRDPSAVYKNTATQAAMVFAPSSKRRKQTLASSKVAAAAEAMLQVSRTARVDPDNVILSNSAATLDEESSSLSSSSSEVQSVRDASGNVNRLGFNSDSTNTNGDVIPRFHPHHEKQWQEMYDELVKFHKKHGHCIVPYDQVDCQRLSGWVQRQRYQHTLMLEGKPATTMTPARVDALNKIDFVWDKQSANWYEHLGKLQEFKKKYLHTNVPMPYDENPKLAVWVKCQRRQYKLYQQGKPSAMTLERFRELENLGFRWQIKKRKQTKADVRLTPTSMPSLESASSSSLASDISTQ